MKKIFCLLVTAVESTTLRPRQNGRHFPEEILKCIFLNENIQILIKISLRFVPMGPINNIQIIGSDVGLAPVRQQAIIWTNDGLGWWGIYGSGHETVAVLLPGSDINW